MDLKEPIGFDLEALNLKLRSSEPEFLWIVGMRATPIAARLSKVRWFSSKICSLHPALP